MNFIFKVLSLIKNIRGYGLDHAKPQLQGMLYFLELSAF